MWYNVHSLEENTSITTMPENARYFDQCHASVAKTTNHALTAVHCLLNSGAFCQNLLGFAQARTGSHKNLDSCASHECQNYPDHFWSAYDFHTPPLPHEPISIGCAYHFFGHFSVLHVCHLQILCNQNQKQHRVYQNSLCLQKKG